MAQILALPLVLLAGGVFAADAAPPKPNPAFEKLKTLAGSWEAQTPSGKTATLSIQLISSGTAVMETMQEPEEDMVTVYAADGDGVALVHFCPTNNQPRMRAVLDPKMPNTLQFRFTGATNLPSQTVGHMQALSIEFVDANHFTEHWTWKEGAKEATKSFTWARKAGS